MFDDSVGIPEMIPVSPLRAVPLKESPAGSAGSISHVPDSIPVRFGRMIKSD